MITRVEETKFGKLKIPLGVAAFGLFAAHAEIVLNQLEPSPTIDFINQHMLAGSFSLVSSLLAAFAGIDSLSLLSEHWDDFSLTRKSLIVLSMLASFAVALYIKFNAYDSAKTSLISLIAAISLLFSKVINVRPNPVIAAPAVGPAA